jgi:hypothetical protein
VQRATAPPERDHRRVRGHFHVPAPLLHLKKERRNLLEKEFGPWSSPVRLLRIRATDKTQPQLLKFPYFNRCPATKGGFVLACTLILRA